jgi:hypothetical protein
MVKCEILEVDGELRGFLLVDVVTAGQEVQGSLVVPRVILRTTPARLEVPEVQFLASPSVVRHCRRRILIMSSDLAAIAIP